MYNFLNYALINRSNSESVKLEDLMCFVRDDSDIDIQITKKFPIKLFGDSKEKLLIKGANELIELFNLTHAEKIDKMEKLENIEYVGLSDKNQIILYFKNDRVSASGIYDFTFDFFEELFHMGKYSTFCIKEGYNDLIKQNMNQLLFERKDKEKQFRLIKKNNELFIRGLTSNRYNNYDNNIALYLSLLALHKFAKENKLLYSVTSGFISDSSLNIVFEQQTAIDVPNVGKVFFGAIVTNSEIRDSAFTFEIRYRIMDVKNGKLYFAGIPDLKDSVFSLNHITGIDKIEQKLENMFKLKQLQDTMLSYISELKNSTTISNDSIQLLMHKIIYSRNLKSETRKALRVIYDKHIVNNTLSIIQAFNKIDSVVTDIDDKVFLERIYHDIIKQIVENKSENI